MGARLDRSHRAARVLPVGVALGLLGLAMPTPAQETAESEDPEICREALAEHPGDELEALRRAEEDRWRAARSASRRGKKLMADSVEQGDTPAQQRRAAQIGRTSQRYRQALREARILCGCRERRGDPYREDCERLFWRYRGALGPPSPQPEPAFEPDGPRI